MQHQSAIQRWMAVYFLIFIQTQLPMGNFWDDRYKQDEFVYGTDPNEWVETYLHSVPAGKALFACEGEGRNALFAATLGWTVSAFDQSEMGREKANRLSEIKKVEIDYKVADAMLVEYEENYFDALFFIYSHFPASIRQLIHRRLLSFVKPGGTIVVEVFHQDQLNLSSGGPKDISMLCTEEILKEDFKGCDFKTLTTSEIELNEGAFHKGPAKVVRMIATKQ
jgi:SAM-dependent methyltransferase